MNKTELPEFSIRTRREELKKLKANTAKVDSLIVGGGIVGAGLLRELAIRGINSLLFEKNDFASGTSSKSSKLIHGGLRYLEMFDFGLVFESLSERHWLLKTHPHLVQPLEFNLPIYEKNKGPKGSRPSGLLGLGLWLYDALSLFRTPFFHGKHSKTETLKLFPGIREKGLNGSYYYADAMMLDDELVLETLLDAKQRGAHSYNYVEVKSVKAKNSEGYYEVDLFDSLAQETFKVFSKEVFVCVGPWTEAFGEHSVVGKSQRKLKPSKGVHLIFPFEKLPVERCLVMYAPDGRIVFAIPRKDLGTGAELVIVGTTDSPYPKDKIDFIETNEDDVEYLLKVLNEYFPEKKLSINDIASTYAGVRPLLDSGEQSEAKTSREHEIWRNDAGVVFMAGGKYTTFRKISEEIADFTFGKSKVHKEESKKLLSSPEEYNDRLKGTPIWGKFTDHWIEWKIKHHCACTVEDVIERRLPVWMAGKHAAQEKKEIQSIAEKTLKNLQLY